MPRGHRRGPDSQGVSQGIHQGGDRSPTGEVVPGIGLDPELAELLAQGNHALTDRLLVRGVDVDPPAVVLTALQISPRDPAWSERLIGTVERSNLAADRKDALVTRIRWDQVAADDVSRAVEAALGVDDPEMRSRAIEAVESAPPGELAERIAAALGGEVAPAQRLVQSLLLVRPFWEEEEEDGDDSLGEVGPA